MAYEKICWVVNNHRAIKVTFRDGFPWVKENAGGSDKEYPKMLTCGSSGTQKGYLLLAPEDEVVNLGGEKTTFTPTVVFCFKNS
ncbi:MAG: hypothetical protein RIQ41_246 [Candidatus Parcubacteria bacterium]|jgi:hypothetical protein